MSLSKLPISKQYLRFIAAGIFFTLAGPSLLVAYALVAGAVLGAILAELSVHSVRYLVYSRYVFAQGSRGLRTYAMAAIPLSLANITIVYLLNRHLDTVRIAILVGIFSGTAGYFWTRFCYRINLSERLRRK